MLHATCGERLQLGQSSEREAWLMAAHNTDLDGAKRAIRWITYATPLLGLVLIIATGVVARSLLSSQGLPVVSWSDSVKLFIPLALFHQITIVVYSIVLRRACIETLDMRPTWLSGHVFALTTAFVDPRNPRDYPKLVYAVTGSSVGFVLLVSAILLASLLGQIGHISTEGLANLVFMTWFIFPVTMGYEVVGGLLAASLGGLIGSLTYMISHRSRGIADQD